MNMKKNEVIDNEYMALWYYPELKIVHHKTKQTLPEGGFERLLSTGADYIEKYRASKWLSDESNLVAISKEDNEWGDTVWAPRVIKAGFKYWAVIFPKSVIGSLQMKRFVKEYSDRGVTVEMFDSVEPALTWLESK